ncbi:MAG TPA: hypothetical protein VGV89_09260 [Thermoplasmata archaeon]|nr:hypothetical protein [Thermoplasmata archaeon]
MSGKGETSVRPQDILKFNPVGLPRIVGSKDEVECAWEIVARGLRRTIDPGEVVTVPLYVCGFGKPDWAKLVFYPPAGLFDATYRDEANHGLGPIVFVSQIKLARLTGAPSSPGQPTIFEVGKEYEFPVAVPEAAGFNELGGAFGIPLPMFSFRALPDDPPIVFQPAKEDRDRPVVGEVDFYPPGAPVGTRIVPPMLVRARINAAAAGGDYTMPVVLVYEDGGKITTNVEDIEIHVRPFWERRSYQILAAVLTALLTFTAGLELYRFVFG